METVLEFKENRKNISIAFHVMNIGRDYVMIVEGGDVPHIGAATLGSNEEMISTHLSHHKEHVITESMFQIMQQNLSSNVLITGGIHLEQITKDEIVLVEEMCKNAAVRIDKYLKENAND